MTSTQPISFHACLRAHERQNTCRLSYRRIAIVGTTIADHTKSDLHFYYRLVLVVLSFLPRTSFVSVLVTRRSNAGFSPPPPGQKSTRRKRNVIALTRHQHFLLPSSFSFSLVRDSACEKKFKYVSLEDEDNQLLIIGNEK